MTTAPAWMRWTLVAAGIYNLVWGAVAILAPTLVFDLLGMPPPNYPGLWQCLGMVIGVYGLGYLIAATNPMRHWPIVLVGLFGKVFGPIGWLFAALNGEFPWKFGWQLLTNDFIWWIPFTAIVLAAYRRFANEEDSPRLMIGDALALARDQNGRTLAELAKGRKLMLVFVRHFGCTFCREALADLASDREKLTYDGVQLAVVHIGSREGALALARQYGLEDIPRFHDPEAVLYRAFGLKRGRLGQLFGSGVWGRGWDALVNGHGLGRIDGDATRMPGVFFLDDGVLVREFRHQSAGDRPDYVALARTCPECAETDARATPSGSKLQTAVK